MFEMPKLQTQQSPASPSPFTRLSLPASDAATTSAESNSDTATRKPNAQSTATVSSADVVVTSVDSSLPATKAPHDADIELTTMTTPATATASSSTTFEEEVEDNPDI